MRIDLMSLDWVRLWHDGAVGLLWIAAVVYLCSRLEQIVFDLWAGMRQHKVHLAFRNRERLSLEKLQSREQQRVALFIPAWWESKVLGPMLEDLISRLAYRNYTIFVGVYPNDPDTQFVVDAFPQVVKVVAPHAGPTNKADCLNALCRGMQAYEQQHECNFDIIVLHDAGNVVHPYSFLLYNYLIPRVDVVQLPVLAHRVPWQQWVHWIYADEYAEYQLRDAPLREFASGFVPLSGVGTALSRRALTLLSHERYLSLFDRRAVAESYDLAKRVSNAQLKTAFVNVVLVDDATPWYVPLERRPGFIVNWAFFPTVPQQSVRQKTRRHLGVTFQEWETHGWDGNVAIKENLLRDRWQFFSTGLYALAIVPLVYLLGRQAGVSGITPTLWPPLVSPGSALMVLLGIDLALLLLRFARRIGSVARVYGMWEGALAFIRIVPATIINVLAMIHAARLFVEMRDGNVSLAWSKYRQPNEHAPSSQVKMRAFVPPPTTEVFSEAELRLMLTSRELIWTIQGLESIPRDVSPATEHRLRRLMRVLAHAQEPKVRAAVARVCGYLGWSTLLPIANGLLRDEEWVVRANAARAVLKFPEFDMVLNDVVNLDDRYAREVLIRALEQDDRIQQRVLPCLALPEYAAARMIILTASPLLRSRFLQLQRQPVV